MLNLPAFSQAFLGGFTSGKSVQVLGALESCGFRSRSENRWFSHALHFPRASDGEMDLGQIDGLLSGQNHPTPLKNNLSMMIMEKNDSSF